MSRRATNLELAMMLGNILKPGATTRPCTQCYRDVPKTQTLLTCDQCRAKKKQQKARRKERDTAIEAGRSDSGFSSAPLLAVVAKQDAETAAKRAARRKDKDGAPPPPVAASAGISNLAVVYQAILDEYHRAAPPLKKRQPATKKAPEAGSSSSVATGTKRKLKDVEVTGPPYDEETAKKRMRGDMPMPPLEPIPGIAAARAKAREDEKDEKRLAKATAAVTSLPTPIVTQSANIPTQAKAAAGPKPQKVQSSLVGWMKAASKAT
ncbi:hypothetical protein B0H15DRAFT_800506 [Mycena belliarum]|uniref:Uncharacterized protein n=1 Tax=Mycena belliarum TaxID=1033014 RepID=A0AAD6U4U2_9AGAR|nr:hypothetical protein B0H15DRAFT_800506 [Mycena belliae]